MLAKLPFTALILAGGKSSRMGRDKALLPFGGKTMLEHTVDLTLPIFQEALVILRDRSKIEGLNLGRAKIHEDLFKNQGPLAGIYTGLAYSTTKAACVFTCDMPFIDEVLIRDLLHFWQDSIDALCFEDEKGRLQPFPGVYSRSSRFIIRALIDQGERSLGRFLEVASVKPLMLQKERIQVLTNLNTIEDYYRVLKEKDEWVKNE